MNTLEPRYTAKTVKSTFSGLIKTWKPIHFDSFKPSVYANTLSVFIQNASISKRSRKWIKTKTHTYRISVDGRKRIKMKMMTNNIAGACVGSMRIEHNLRHNVQFYRFRTF